MCAGRSHPAAMLKPVTDGSRSGRLHLLSPGPQVTSAYTVRLGAWEKPGARAARAGLRQWPLRVLAVGVCPAGTERPGCSLSLPPADQAVTSQGS